MTIYLNNFPFLRFKDEYDVIRKSQSKISEFLRKIETNIVKRLRPTEEGRFILCDELAVAVALCDDIVTSSLTTHATVELSGEDARGQMVLDWLKRNVPKHKVKVVTDVNRTRLMEMLVKTSGGESM